jgi:ABC-type sugar transport system substrate-binding protein
MLGCGWVCATSGRLRIDVRGKLERSFGFRVQAAEEQIPFISTLVSQKVGVIAIAGNHANAVAPALKRATQQGVKVVSYDSDVAPSARTLFFNQAKGDSLAEMMIESRGQMIGYEGDFAILSSSLDCLHEGESQRIRNSRR